MATTSTLKQIIEQLVRETGCGWTLPAEITIAATTLTLADSYGSGPWTGTEFPVGALVKITSPADSGYATSSSTTTITDTAKAWAVNEWTNFVVRMSGFAATVTSNTATALTFATQTEAPPIGRYVVELGDTYIQGYVPSTGVITISPSFQGTLNAAQVRPVTGLIIYPQWGIRRFDYLLDCINRASTNRTFRWQRVPLTFVPDGDLMGQTIVTDYWTGSNATPTYNTPVFPAAGTESADYARVSRALRSTATSSSNYVESNAIDVPKNAAIVGYQWYAATAIRVVSNSGGSAPTATIQVYDKTNSALITTYTIAGSDTFTLTNSGKGFMNAIFTFNVPTGCDQIAFRLVAGAGSFGTNVVVEMAPLVAFPTTAVTFPFSDRVIAPEEYIGNFFYSYPTSSTNGLFAMAFSDSLLSDGRRAKINDNGDHLEVVFNFRPTMSVWYDEAVSGSPLLGMSDIVVAPLDYIVKWSKYEFYKWLYQQEEKTYFVSTLGRTVPVPSKWKDHAIEAFREADRSPYSPRLYTVTGRQ